MSLYMGMDADALETQYNLRARRGSDFDELMASWVARSEKLRDTPNARVDLAYGQGEREKLDFFSGGDSNSALVIYIHGGYWQRGNKEMHSFCAEAFVKHGVSVSMLNYDLTPAVRMGQIPAQIRKAVAWNWHNADQLGFSKDKLYIMGHSAGGHLTAMMMATDWSAYDDQIPDDVIRAGIPVSGVFELEPIIHTSLNEGPQMDIEEAIEQSPTFIPPVTNAPQLVVAGGGETTEFLRQSDDYADKFRTVERSMERYNVPEADHFDELERLSEDDSVFFEKCMMLIDRTT